MNKLYSVHDHWTDINKKNDVDIESIDGVISGIKVNGEDYGGSEYQNIYDNTINTVLDSDGFYTTNIGVVIEADSIKVTFDGVEYSCPKRSISEIGTNFYGAPTPLETGEESFDWADYPFSIVTGSGGVSMVVTTQTAGSHSLKIDIPQSEGGESDFSMAEVEILVPDTKKLFIPITNNGAPFAGVFPRTGNNESGTVDVVLYKGSAMALWTGSTPLTISGNIELVQNGMYKITGDCKIQANFS